MLSFRQFRKLDSVAINATEFSFLEERNSIDLQIEKLVDDWINELKSELFQGTLAGSQRSMWDRFKNTISNIWYGRQHPENPYVWRNKLGDDLGRPVESVTCTHMTLNNYKHLNEALEVVQILLEDASTLPAGTANLRIMQIINQKAEILKRRLKDLFKKFPPSVSNIASIATKPVLTTQKKLEPAAAAPEQEVVPPIEATKDRFHFENLPNTNKNWNQLNAEEKKAWNELGGGITSRSHRSKIGEQLPQIIRLGDPRRKIMENTPSNMRGKNYFQWYKTQYPSRVESESNPIKSEIELRNNIRTRPLSTAETGEEKSIQQTTNRAKRTRGTSTAQSIVSPVNEPDASAAAISPLIDYDSLKTVAEDIMLLDEDKSKSVKEKLSKGEEFASELQDEIVKFLNDYIKNFSEEKQASLKDDLEKAQSPKKLKEFIEKHLMVFESANNKTKRLVKMFREMCQG